MMVDEIRQNGTPGECPEFEVLERAAETSRAPTAVVRHIEGCDACRNIVRELRSNLEFLAGCQSTLPAAAKEVGPLEGPVPGYHVIKRIHGGAQAVVFEAVQLSTRRTVALKLLLQGRYGTRSQRMRFQRGVELAARLHHPNIVRIFDTGVTDDGRVYTAMEHVTGGTLEDWVRRRYGRDTRSALLQDLELFAHVCDAVEHAHRSGVIHRDIKPANILVDELGQPYLCDFGMAKGTRPDRWSREMQQTKEGAFAGTIAYAAPERLDGRGSRFGRRTDVYSLGATLYQLITRQRPHPDARSPYDAIRRIVEEDPKPPSAFRPGADEHLDAVILKALNRSPEERYASAAELADDVRRWMDGLPVSARPATTGERFERWMKRNRQMLSVITLSLMVLVLGAWVTILHADLAESRDTVNTLMTAIQKRDMTDDDGELRARLSVQPARDWDSMPSAPSPRGTTIGARESRIDPGDLIAQAEAHEEDHQVVSGND